MVQSTKLSLIPQPTSAPLYLQTDVSLNVKEAIHCSSVVFDEGCKVGFGQFAIQSETLFVHRLLEGARSKDGLVVFSINVCHNKWNEMMLYNLTTSGVQEGKTTILGINFNLFKIYIICLRSDELVVCHSTYIPQHKYKFHIFVFFAALYYNIR